MLKRIVVEQSSRTQSAVKLLDKHLESLSKELNFLSSLELMDDILADDIDRRVSRLLSQKKDDLELDICFMVVNLEGKVIASSDKKRLLSSFKLESLTEKKGKYIEARNLYMYSKIEASFNPTQEIGFMILKYNMQNLQLYLSNESTLHSYIVDRKKSFNIGENLALNLNFEKNEATIIDDEHVITYQKISQLLGEWYLVFAVDKSIALAPLYDFIRFTLYVSFFIFMLIIYLSFRYARGVVQPIERLTKLTQRITKTQDYSVELELESEDEIATLSKAFNKMTQTTSEALEKLEKENRLRLKRFTQLIELFNTIIQTKTQEECIKVSIREISKFRDKKDLYFIEDKNLDKDKKFTQLYVSDFENNAKVYIGSISLDMQSFEDKYEHDFYNSISAMISLQLDKIRLIEKTELASGAKSKFISNMSHELRTPLNSIMGAAQYMISYENLKDEQIDRLGNIEDSAHYLLEMINEILDIAKIEAGKLEVNLQYVSVLKLVESIYSMLSPLASDKNLDFVFIHEDFKDKEYETDPKLLQQILINLLSNAIKFTQNGTIILKLYSDEKDILISVKDSGIGVAKEDIELLFHDFTQLQSSTEKIHGGTGLGLSLSKKLANLLEGDVLFESEGLDRGSEVVFSFVKKSKGL